MENLIVSIDPGETSGYCVYSPTSNKIIEYGVTKNTLSYFSTLLKNGIISLVIIEKFVLFAATAISLAGDEMRTSQIIGALKWMCEEENISIYESEPMRKIAFTDNKLKKYKLYVPNIHIRDSIRHLLSYLAQYKGVNPRTIEI